MNVGRSAASGISGARRWVRAAAAAAVIGLVVFVFRRYPLGRAAVVSGATVLAALLAFEIGASSVFVLTAGRAFASSNPAPGGRKRPPRRARIFRLVGEETGWALRRRLRRFIMIAHMLIGPSD